MGIFDPAMLSKISTMSDVSSSYMGRFASSGGFGMRFIRLFALVPALFGATAQAATGDLLVAPTRIVLDGARGTEVILNNIGAEPATYRVSLELRRMTPEGVLDDVEPTAANEVETKSVAIISYAPRRITLLPNQPQAIRIGIRAPQGLPDGEYRAHMLFRAIPDAKAVTEKTDEQQSLSIALTPIYGVTIPVIIRQGNLSATASMSNAQIVTTEDSSMLNLTLARTGTRSTYGTIRVLKAGESKPAYEAKGVAVYPEVTERKVNLDMPPELAAALKGPVTIQYVEEGDAGTKVLAELKTVLR
jgi:P pilus assembly chaperone PapD